MRATLSTRRGVGFWLVAFIGASTAFAGVVQVFVPGAILGFLDAEKTPTTRHLFAIVGMFMAIIGAALVHALFDDRAGERRVILLWAGLQKLGAFAAVSLGVRNDIFGGLGVLVALNDLASSAIVLWYRRSLRAAR